MNGAERELTEAGMAMLRELADHGGTVWVDNLTVYRTKGHLSGGHVLRWLIAAGYAEADTMADVNSNLRYGAADKIGPDCDTYWQANITEAGLALLKGTK
jgi:hypothetical protein